jgi:hypothetical protein
MRTQTPKADADEPQSTHDAAACCGGAQILALGFAELKETEMALDSLQEAFEDRDA